MSGPWRTRAWIAATLLPLAMFFIDPVLQALSRGSPPSLQATTEETVAFNTKSLKFHCKTCTWAKRCTVNCIDLPKSEALRRGGVPCKVCGGSCNR